MEENYNYEIISEIPLKERDSKLLVEFIDFCFDKLKLDNDKLVSIDFVVDRNNCEGLETTGVYLDPLSKIGVYIKGRAFADIIRTLAHELIHKKQYQVIGDKVTTVNQQKVEDQSNAYAGRLVRAFGYIHPEIYINE